jgi:Glycosyl hydrolase family 59/Ricin-type beta-trefoil lectin domain-like
VASYFNAMCVIVASSAILGCSSGESAASGDGGQEGTLESGSPSARDSSSSSDGPGTGGDGASAGNGDGGSPGGDGSSGVDAGPPPSCPLGGSGTSVAVVAGTGAGSASQTITLDGTGTGRALDGIGAISGGGGNSRLLFDYPEPQRTQILDLLFKPGYGAALQILKVEIGGDTQSTDGAEASHMHTASDLNCNRGYEWWLMQQAKVRNPNIKLYALSWGAPGWVGEADGGGNFWSTDNINYHIAWLQCAKTNGLTIDYMGGWNENGHDETWYEEMHAALATNGFATKMVGDDSFGWGTADDMLSDPMFDQAVDVVGSHYPCGYLSSQTSCPSSANAVATGKPLFASENGSQDYNGGAPAMARGNNRTYLDGAMTGTINWPLIASILPNLSFEGDGLAVADQPWSGWYDAGLQLWVTAHTTQFTQPGWTYIDSSSGYIGGAPANGSYVTLKSPTSGDYSVIVETADPTTPQTLAFQVTGGLSTQDVHIWATDMGSTSTNDFFVHAVDVTNSGSAYWLTLQPNYVYTITTTTGQCKSAATSPAAQPSQPLPYTEDFEGRAVGTFAPLISDMEGSFEIAPCTGGTHTGQCYRQMAPIYPVGWVNVGTAFTLVGTGDWDDYTITSDVLLESPGSVELMGRFSGFDYNNDGHVSAYYMSVADTGAWSIFANNQNDGTHVALASGTVSPLGTNVWHTIAFMLQGPALTATIDGVVAGTANDSTYTSGLAGLSVGSASNTWGNAQFDNLSVTGFQKYVIVNHATGWAIDINGGATTAGAAAIQWPLTGAANQTWGMLPQSGGAFALSNANSQLVLSLSGAAAAGVTLDQEPAGGTVIQQWTSQPAATAGYVVLVSTAGNFAIASPSANQGDTLVVDVPDGSPSQEWSLQSAP